VRALIAVIGDGTYISPKIDSETAKSVIDEVSDITGLSTVKP
jgi:hypothetical protein